MSWLLLLFAVVLGALFLKTAKAAVRWAALAGFAVLVWFGLSTNPLVGWWLGL